MQHTPSIGCTNLLDFLMFRGGFQYGGDVIREAELIERLDDVVAGDRLLGLFLRDFVRLRADEGDKLNAAFDEDVSSFLGECDAWRTRQDLADYLLDGGLKEVSN
jgi:hypothetical protein